MESDKKTKIIILAAVSGFGFVLSLANLEYLECHYYIAQWMFVFYLHVILVGIGLLLINKKHRKLKLGIWGFLGWTVAFNFLWNIFGTYQVLGSYFSRMCMSDINVLFALLFQGMVYYFYILLAKRCLTTNPGEESLLIRLSRFVKEDIRSAGIEYNHISYSHEALLENELRQIGTPLNQSEVVRNNNVYPQSSNLEHLDAMGLLSEMPSKVNVCASCGIEVSPFEEMMSRKCGHQFHEKCFVKSENEKGECLICHGRRLEISE